MYAKIHVLVEDQPMEFRLQGSPTLSQSHCYWPTAWLSFLQLHGGQRGFPSCYYDLYSLPIWPLLRPLVPAVEPTSLPLFARQAVAMYSRRPCQASARLPSHTHTPGCGSQSQRSMSHGSASPGGPRWHLAPNGTWVSPAWVSLPLRRTSSS